MYTSNQQVFDIVATHLQQQGRASTGTNGIACFYKNHEGLKCAIGVLIPNDMYTFEMECGDVRCLLNAFPGFAELFDFSSVRLSLLSNLQWIHDHAGPGSELCMANLRRVAEVFELNTNCLTEPA